MATVMANKSGAEPPITVDAIKRPGKGGTIPPGPLFPPGNRQGGRPPNAGLSLREEVNRLVAADPTEDELRSLATARKTGFRRRAAAIELLIMLELPDIADFEPL